MPQVGRRRIDDGLKFNVAESGQRSGNEATERQDKRWKDSAPGRILSCREMTCRETIWPSVGCSVRACYVPRSSSVIRRERREVVFRHPQRATRGRLPSSAGSALRSSPVVRRERREVVVRRPQRAARGRYKFRLRTRDSASQKLGRVRPDPNSQRRSGSASQTKMPV
jgi:hypothetical protein